MYKYLLLLTSLLFASAVQSQTSISTKKQSSYAMPSRDYVMLQVGYENWLNVPDSINLKGLHRTFNAYICYDFPIAKSNFSFAAGVGIGTTNMYFNNQRINFSDTTTYVQFVPETTPDYKKYKLATAYAEAPFELRYFSNKDNRNMGFKAAVGMRIGHLVNAHTKGKYTLNNKPIVDKISTRRYLDTWRYAATLRLGYGNFSVYGAYSLGNLFRTGSGPEGIRTFQVGLCVTGL